jgi:hypothetical protein
MPAPYVRPSMCRTLISHACPICKALFELLLVPLYFLDCDMGPTPTIGTLHWSSFCNCVQCHQSAVKPQFVHQIWYISGSPSLNVATAILAAPSVRLLHTKTVLGHRDHITEFRHSFEFWVPPCYILLRRLSFDILWYAGTILCATSLLKCMASMVFVTERIFTTF